MSDIELKMKRRCELADLFSAGAFSKIVATRNEQGSWQLFGLSRSGNQAVFVQKARGDVREWSSLDFLSKFCTKMNIEKWEVHARIFN